MRGFRRGASASVFLLGLFAASMVSGSDEWLEVNESATRLRFREASVEASLVVENRSRHTITASIDLELINQVGRVGSSSKKDIRISPGRSDIVFTLDLHTTLNADDQTCAFWWRLRYSITTSPSNVRVTKTNGIISVSEISPDFFELIIIAPPTLSGSHYRARVQARHPVTFDPRQGVQLVSKIRFQESPELSSIASSVTKEDGYALLEFSLPPEARTMHPKLEVVGSLGDISQQAEMNLLLDRQIRITITTDKPIYQPGQTLHIRLLAQDANMRALRNAALKLRVEDPDETAVFRTDLATSRFGVASADWQIPDNSRLGDYTVKIDTDHEEQQETYWYPYKVKISRYELPNFSVNVKPDRRFYLPGQNAAVEISSDYLFGRPVTSGRVRVVHETSREWNYREQKWDTQEGDKYEGKFDKTGKFLARIDLTKAHAKLAEDEDARFEDLSMAAYVTDDAGGRTEQRRFDLRVTRDPIHVYLIEDGTYRSPADFYVSTYYADGHPAECTVTIRQSLIDASPSSQKQWLTRVKTNKYGLAKASRLNLSLLANVAELSFSAADARGRAGTATRRIWVSQDSMMRIETDKSIYRPSEPIKVSIESNPPAELAVIDIARNWIQLRSETLKLNNGRGQIVLPFTDDYRGEVTILAYVRDETGRWDQRGRTVLFPDDRELRIGVTTSRDQYKPGEEALSAFQVQAADGRPVESALGVSVIDRAVEERMQSDRDFGADGHSHHFNRTWGRAESLGGITRSMLDKLDTAKPISKDLDLVAEVLLRSRGYFLLESNSDYGSRPTSLYYWSIQQQLLPIKAALDSRYSRKDHYPKSSAELFTVLDDFGITFDQMRDPWGVAYVARFSTKQRNDVLEILSTGPDKRAGTADDFIALRLDRQYFKPIGQSIDRVIGEYHLRTGGYIRDSRRLKRELTRSGLAFDKLRDRWGKPYRPVFSIDRTRYVIEIWSSAENGRFEPGRDLRSDDFMIWRSAIDYSFDLHELISPAIAGYFTSKQRLPQNEEEFGDALGSFNIDRQKLRDPWGRQCYTTFRILSQYGDKVTIYSYARHKEAQTPKTVITPVTQKLFLLNLRSTGEDGKEGTADDFDITSFSRMVDQVTSEGASTSEPGAPVLSGASGGISGMILDENDAVVSPVKVTAKSGNLSFETTSDEHGKYLFSNLSPGRYEVHFEAAGFKTTLIVDVPVVSSNVTEVNATLAVGAVTEAVVVNSSAGELQITSAQVSELQIDGRRPMPSATASRLQNTSTPRLREYFPETLVWQPSLETDLQGQAQLKFKLADNITTWKLSVLASTENGEVGTAEKEIVAFQPFFIEHDPPPVLTEGDRISLPVVVRNYLEQAQSVNLEMTPADWFKLIGDPQRRIDVKAGDFSQEVFSFEATRWIEKGEQRITATAADASDAIEKPVSVHPDGEEVVTTTNRTFGERANLTLIIPPTSISGTARAQVKIYPNLVAHLIESIEAIRERPYGCAEQIISAAYPSLLLLRNSKIRSQLSPTTAARAERYLKSGYDQLLSNRNYDGSFSYWVSSGSDVALTAYALKFLDDAREIISIDEQLADDARAWLIKQQRADGSWPVVDRRNVEDRRRTALQTAFVTRVLAHLFSRQPQTTGPAPTKGAKINAITRALAYLSRRIQEIDEPYLIASYGLAASRVGDSAGFATAASLLRDLAREEAGATYWALETNTPFYGWGLAGRLETTALAVQALAAGPTTAKDNAGTESHQSLVDRGLDFLLRKKDRYGVWYSTQATVNVLDAITTVLGQRESPDFNSKSAGINVNGRAVTSVELPPSGKLVAPLSVDISRFVAAGENRIEINRDSPSSQATVQIVSSHYEPWRPEKNGNGTGPLKFSVSFDKTEARVGDEITCSVEAERVGFQGYGMMLAEIGLPPGADVDRASMDRAMKESGWGVYRYDLLPDRLIVYLWPSAGGTKFQFKLRSRYGLAAKSAASVLYDYYNPEARVVIAPTSFTIE